MQHKKSDCLFESTSINRKMETATYKVPGPSSTPCIATTTPGLKPVLYFRALHRISFFWLVQTMIECWQALRQGDDTGNSTPFIEFSLGATLTSCEQLIGDVTGEVEKLITLLPKPMSRNALQEHLGLKSQTNFRERYL